MVTLKYQVGNKLHEGAQSVLLSARRKDDGRPVVLKMLRDDYPSPEKLAQFRQEYEITRQFQVDSIIRVYAVETYEHRPVMVLEDFGGISLRNYLDTNPLPDVETGLTLAIKMTAALAEIHKRRVMHKDINPSNVMFNPETGQLKVIDFGISTTLPREQAAFAHPDLLEGTPPYISPEQTGRMNRAIDYRTDFYSLGVTLFELFTGLLPFATKDLLELLHSHIARQPPLLHEVRRGIPPILSEIVMKLMAKNAERRYLSAYGIMADLEECLRQWQETGRVESFALGARDMADGLELPQTLYGREPEVARLMQAFEQAAAGEATVMLVAGSAGVGKTALIQEVHKPITGRRGYFVAGKFDRLQRDIPYAPLIQAFQDLVRHLLHESEAELGRWRERMLVALGQSGQLIIDVIPEVELIIGPQPDLPELPAVEAQNRFYRSFQNFVQVFTQPEHPLVLFLDDLQWADIGSLKLIDALLTATGNRYLLLLGAYRDNEVDAAHPLQHTLTQLQEKQVTVEEITLRPLALSHIGQFVGDALRRPAADVRALAEVLQQKTGGNPFFMREFLQSLYESGLISVDFGQRRWQWDLAQINRHTLTENVAELLGAKVNELPEQTQRVLREAASIGNRFDLQTLALVEDRPLRQTASDLWPALTAGLVVPLDDAYRLAAPDANGHGTPELLELPERLIAYRFTHDRIQQAVYSMLDADERQQTHWRVGRRLLEATPAEQQEQTLYDIVNQLNLGRMLAATEEDRERLAELNVKAGRRAKAAAAHSAAYGYFQVGMELLASDAWQRDYGFALDLHLETAEAAYLSGDYEAMERYVSVVLERAGDLLDQVRAHEIRILSYVTRLQPQEAIATALEVLKLLGVDFPKRPNRLRVMFGLLRTRLLLRGKTGDDLAALPEMTDPQRLAIIRITSRVFSAAFRANPPLFLLFVFKVIQLSVSHGNTPLSAFAYACYGLILCGFVGNVDGGYEFGQLALRLLDRFDAKALKARTYMVIETFVRPWKEDVRSTLPALLEGYESGLETGDFEFAAYLAYVYIRAAYFVGMELEELEARTADYVKTIGSLQQKSALHLAEIYWQVQRNLLGLSADPLRLTGEAYNEEEMLPAHLETNDRTAIFNHYLNRLILAALFGAYEAGVRDAALLEPYLDGGRGSSGLVLFHFYASLVRLARYEQMAPNEQREVDRQVRASLKKLKTWSESAPMNYMHQYLLLQAEAARVAGRHQDAATLYDRAIEQAQRVGYPAEEVIAQERAARFYMDSGRERLAQLYLVDARYAGLRWGARALVRRFDERYAELLAQPVAGQATTGATVSFDTSTTSSSRQVTVIDLATVLKASQALSGEIVLDSLLRRLMRILLENTGARRGMLILEDEGEWLIEAEGAVGEEDIPVLQSVALTDVAPTAAPLSLLNYVRRTRESVVLANAAEEGPFVEDPYVREHALQSVLCAPLVNQGRLTGLVWLENNLTAGAFTRERLELVNLLSGQAAISIQNARLYNNLEEALAHQVRLTNAYSRFVPREILQSLDRDSILEVRLGDQTQREMTLLFSDMRSFTQLSEPMTPQENFNFINAYLGRVSPIIREHHGFIDKFIGDAIMALFPRQAQDALFAAIAMHKQVAEYNTGRREKSRPAIRIGIGLHTGMVMLGTVGEAERMDGTVISDAVNLASRLEKLTKLYESAILISQDTLNALPAGTPISTRFLGRVKVEGKEEIVSIYEVLDGDSAEVAALKQQTDALFQQALTHYYGREMEEAAALLGQVLESIPDDKAARLYRRRALHLLEYGIPAGWQGVEILEVEKSI